MAGTYVDVPARRMALPSDGTRYFFVYRGASPTTTEVPSWANNLDDSTTSTAHTLLPSGNTADQSYRCLALVFPELRDISAYFATGAQLSLPTAILDWSTDTTDGLDGTWTTIANNFLMASTTVPHIRTEISTITPITGVRGIRFHFGFGVASTGGTSTRSASLSTIHLYGSISAGQNPDRLDFWHPTSDAVVTGGHFDFGDIKQGASAVKQFRVKNRSAAQTATSVSLSREVATFTEMLTGDSNVEFSSDGSAYANTLAVGTLAPGALSSVLYVRRRVGAAETGTSVPKDARIVATAASWS